MRTAAERVLTIFWDACNGQEEAEGIYVYGYWRGESPPAVAFPIEAWPTDTGFHRFRFPLHGPGWTVARWSIRIVSWPRREQWAPTIEATLRAHVDAGARVAWCALEGEFADPPDLFKPEQMSGGVFAALSPSFGFRCTARLGEPFETLTDADLLTLRKEL